jgi:hypothetical protein
MSTPFRSAFAVLLIGMALAAAAVAPAHSTDDGDHDFMGTWITWAGGEGGGQPVCRRLYVTADGPATRDGAWDAPGWNGLVNGTLDTVEAGRPQWRGEWRDGQIAGTFALTLRADDAFEGTFAGAGLPTERWRGRRDTGAEAPDVPCRFER